MLILVNFDNKRFEIFWHALDVRKPAQPTLFQVHIIDGFVIIVYTHSYSNEILIARFSGNNLMGRNSCYIFHQSIC